MAGFNWKTYRTEPLVEVVEARGGMLALLDRAKITEEADRKTFFDRYRHGKKRGSFTLRFVDEVCVDVLDTLPQLVYGEEWWK